MRRRYLAGFIVWAMLQSGSAKADQQGSLQEVRTMALDAAEFLRANGPEKAFPLFNTGVAPWRDHELFVVVWDVTGKVAAHGGNSALIGRQVLDARDVDLKPFVQEALAIPESGWLTYRWLNTRSNLVEARSSFIVRVGDYAVEVGTYDR